MTRKEIEKKCREEMQTNIPNREALWQKIESSLPEQPVSQPVRRIQISFTQKAMIAAACLLFVLAGMKFINQKNIQISQSEPTPAEAGSQSADNAIPAEEAEGNEHGYHADIPQNSKNTAKAKPIRYDNLHIEHSGITTTQINYQKLGTDGEYFNEDEILAKTQYFFDVKVLESHQNENTGEMTYQLSVIRVLGGEREGEPENSQITLKSCSAYILEQNHEYILPLYYDDDWNLSYSCAPQIEKTIDDKLVIPNGWYTLMQGETTPVLYDSYGIDDYFYDRMYLTGNRYLNLLIQKWENL